MPRHLLQGPLRRRGVPVRGLLLVALLGLAGCGSVVVGASAAAGAAATEKAKGWIWTSKPDETAPAWHAGHCDYDKRYWCSGGSAQCCSGCGARCN